MKQLEEFVSQNPKTQPAPCQFCDLCSYRDHCRGEWRENLSLFELSHTTKLQEKRLRDVGINNLEDLVTASKAPQSMYLKTFNKLKMKAELRLPRLNGGNPKYKLNQDQLDEHDNPIIPPHVTKIFFLILREIH